MTESRDPGPGIRVVRIITRLNIGGPAIQAIDLTRELRSSGFDTWLIHGRLSSGEGDMTSLLPLEKERAVYVDDLVRPISPWHDVRAFWRIYRALRRWQPQIVHTHTAKAGTVGRLAALFYNRSQNSRKKARLVHTYHGHVFDGYFDSWSTRLFLFIERRLAAHTDVLVAISDRVRHDLLHTYRIAREAQIQVIPLGFDLAKLLALTDADRLAARAALDLPDRSIVVTTVGRLTGIKDHSLFLEAAANLARQSTRFVFLLVGDGELRRQLEEQSARLGIASRTRFLGWRGDLPTIYGATDVFVLTSRNEGTPVALIEAMAAGVAVVSTDVGGVGDVIPRQELGLRVGRADAQSLSDAVERLGDSPAVRAEMGRAARAFVTERFSRLRLLEDIRGLYWRLLGLPY